MFKNLSAKYYQQNQKMARESYQKISEKEKKKKRQYGREQWSEKM